ncbi:10866_t:CDS:2 [Acaulospora morrowiae]|uniref:10866_t:CDS:1 n=1 Tax=Acaulospora morrowiae TaxID=94023 RepID=A0A9N8WBQ8_9GLOM|nr:10866_t:CDS:2 [Acaulospora morrowiae]
MSTTDVTVLIPGNGQQTERPNPHTQHSLSRAEIVHGVANRIIYSRFYSWLYLGMALLSIVPIVLSLTEECQTVGFIVLEVIINTVMIAEVITRFLALGKLFWKSIFNIADIILVFLCVTTLIFLLKGGCSHKGEEVFDLVLLIARNLIQFGRIILMLRKNKKNRKARNATVNFDNIRESSVSMDIDSLSNRAFLITDEEDDFL